MLVYAVCPFAVRYTNDGCVKTIQRMPPFTERPHVFIYRRIIILPCFRQMCKMLNSAATLRSDNATTTHHRKKKPRYRAQLWPGNRVTCRQYWKPRSL